MENNPLHDDNFYLGHIRDAINSINEYLGDMNYDSFSQNKMVVSATVREIEIIGEASNNLNKQFRDAHPDIPWRDIIDMRNFLAHEYFGVNTKVVWDTCKNDLPELKSIVNSLLPG